MKKAQKVKGIEPSIQQKITWKGSTHTNHKPFYWDMLILRHKNPLTLFVS